MCGICGSISCAGKDIEMRDVRSMMKKIKHRGPDDEGVYNGGAVGFGFVRLSILDLSPAGHQPMSDETGRFTIVFNGEIYNYIELREQLHGRGHKFHSGTDTEVLLKAFMEWDVECLDRLNGMFAFAIHDKQKERTFIARDRYGIKPLYYYKDDPQFWFASEIPSLLAVLDRDQINPNNQAIFDYLAFNRTDQTTNTFFRGIQKLQHGHYIDIDRKGFNIHKWYTLTDKLDNPFQSADEFKDIFSSSVGLRLRSDVPVGACLSGGLDSSSIVSILLDDYKKDNLHTFSAVYEKGQKGDESAFINLFKGRLKNMHFITPTAESLFADMDTFIGAQAEPLPSTSPYAQYKVMELASKHVVVTLDGQGADEQLGGYHYFFGNYFKELLDTLKLLKLASEGYHYIKYHRSLYAFKTLAFFLLPEKLKVRARLKEKGYIRTELIHAHSSNNVIANKFYDSKNLQSALINHFEYKLEHLLKWEDRNSMRFSLESRVPFLDHRLVEKTLSLASEKIIQKGYTKHILRDAMKGMLPEEIRLRQDKMGFGTPEDAWFRSPFFSGFIQDLIHSKEFCERDIFKVQEVQQQYNRHINQEINISREIWKWINLELWFRKFID